MILKSQLLITEVEVSHCNRTAFCRETKNPFLCMLLEDFERDVWKGIHKLYPYSLYNTLEELVEIKHNQERHIPLPGDLINSIATEIRYLLICKEVRVTPEIFWEVFNQTYLRMRDDT